MTKFTTQTNHRQESEAPGFFLTGGGAGQRTSVPDVKLLYLSDDGSSSEHLAVLARESEIKQGNRFTEKNKVEF